MLRNSAISISLATFVLACSGSDFKGSVQQAAPKPSNNEAKPEDPVVNPPPSTEIGEVGLPEPVPPGNALDKCNAASGKLLSTTQTVTYAARRGCEFTVESGNMLEKDMHITAIHTTSTNLKLPEGTLCSIAIESDPSANFRYDDMLIFSLDDKVLFSSTVNLKEFFSEKEGVFTWKREELLGKRPSDFGGRPYCLGDGAECVMPETDQAGRVAIGLPIGKIAPIVNSFGTRKEVPLSLSATGDNDNSDCSHSDLVLKIDMKYAP